MAAYMGSSFTGGLPAIAATATCITLKIGGGEQPEFPPPEPHAPPRTDTTQCVTLVGPATPAWRQSTARYRSGTPPILMASGSREGHGFVLNGGILARHGR